MEKFNSSYLFNTSIEQKAIFSNFNDSGALNILEQNQDPNLCSTPCGLENAKRVKRKISLQTIHCKFAKLDSEFEKVNEKNCNEYNETSFGSTLCDSADDTVEQTTIIERSEEDFITLDETYNITDSTLKTTVTPSFVSKEKSWADDETLLISSSDENEEEKENVESYYYLLDSPPRCLEDETLPLVDTSRTFGDTTDSFYPQVASKVVAAKSIVQNVDSCYKQLFKENKNTEPAEQSVDDSKVGDLSTANLNLLKEHVMAVKSSQNKFPSKSNKQKYKHKNIIITIKKNTIPRSKTLKVYLNRHKNNQQVVYPKYLEEYKKMCSGVELIDLMSLIYTPSPGFVTNKSLSVQNYRNALQFVGKSPDMKHQTVSDCGFYNLPSDCSFKRFAS